MEKKEIEEKLPWWQNAICYLVCASIAVWLFLEFTCIDVLAGCGFQDGAETSTHENWYCINFNYNPDKRIDNYTSAYIKVESDLEVVFYTGDDNVIYGMAAEDGLYCYGHGHERDGSGLNGMANNDRKFSKYQTVTDCYWGGYMITSDLIRDYTDNVKIFDSEDSAKAYILTGDTSGQTNKAPVDYTHVHDFSKDTYSTKIPIPEVSNIHMNGFTLTNKGDYWYDVIVKSKLRGVDIETSSTTASSITGSPFLWDRKFVVSKHQIHGSHYWNFTVAHVGTNQTNFNMLDIYGQDNEAALLEDFKVWSERYPTYRDLPTFKFTDTSISMSDTYKKYYVYDEINGLSKLKNNGMTETTFYIRYYDNTDMTYGQWVSYTYNPGNEETIATTLTTGTVEVLPDGTVIQNGYVQGTTDANGNISYNTATPDTSTGSALTTMLSGFEQFRQIIENFKVFIGDLPDLISFLFGFLPWWLTAMLCAIVVVAIVLRVVGR